ncbi:NADPH:quinone reductase-like Zn-dependent oxidoreductase [Mycolicibacterium sp. BK556]|uniref:quinone oxidoreductase family protein n=1 Tax=Mycobacteriaceae TaxID=1762 RepID=UPI0010613B7A|nr:MULTISPECIES: zinc-binding alcohol dehydrogenase family protein [Mycobacteriaceae]MBB3606667.1 NADPH:quinone reductase-like Zn-dependent oxidoreductase [Mycolicibacterium sp. BK556]MBB3636667.1 NADPH:quinone reductase-like Zn-dependent oxidoreductase [Mycolicibacterium sp. BK607]MBB3754247.1 NADPH:quinone reductase-like Zn-dependent oxidoreductase [Mycolicibacterium sp. BK634]TDO17111.1 NADPH:quinone reductase-like Zn-dependent oxidoreductase [Mycobacterium sp. BK086]
MYAAVVTDFAKPPAYQDFPQPTATADSEVVVDVIAAGLHPLVRSRAAGTHYTSTGALPLVPGIDGVGRAPDGTLRYFVVATDLGAMAEQTLVDLRRSVVLPDDADPVAIAAAMNPAMSSWVALRRRTTLQPGQTVVVLGATGSAGRLAIQAAKHLGAGTVIGVGRDRRQLDALPELGADQVIALDELGTNLERVIGADIVIDYIWGPPAAELMAGLARGRHDSSQPLTWIQIGSMASLSADIPSAALRSMPLQIVGSGIGSVPVADIVAELPQLAVAIANGTLRTQARAVPLKNVEQVWQQPENGQRVVLTP